MTASPQASLGRPMTSYKVSEREARRSYQVTIHDLYCEEERCILATASLTRDPHLTEPTSVAVVTCKMEFFDVLSKRQSEGEVTFSIVRNQRLVNPIPADAKDEIELQRVRCEVASTLGKAGSLADAGDIPGARRVLAEMEGKVRKNVMFAKPAAQPLAQHLHRTVRHSLEGLEDKVTYVKHGKSTLTNYAHSHWQQRSNATPSLDGHRKWSDRTVSTASHTVSSSLPSHLPTSSDSSCVTSPYRISSKCKMMAKHSSSRAH